MTLARTFGSLAVASSLLAACQQAPQTVTLSSLESNGRMSFVCLGRNFQPRNIGDCPDKNPVDGEVRNTYSLVTQKRRGEVALVDLDSATVIDEERSAPGFNFLPVGAEPTAIVSTPGSVATFVSVAELGKEGIFALPTSCIAPRIGRQPVRDITTWSACRLPSAPAEMALLFDAEPGRTSCDSTPLAPPSNEQCPADLTTETTLEGQRRKLAVALPDGRFRGDRAGIAVIDAQAVLNRPPGVFEPCHIEHWLPLLDRPPTTEFAEKLPAGYILPPSLPRPPPVPSSRPAGFAQVDDPRTGEHRLFIADLEAPVIHDLDTSDPCNLKESTTPLLPQSFADSNRAVTTNKVAVSPLTTEMKRYLYAIDELGGGTVELGGLAGGSVMIFDVSPDSKDRAPQVLPNAQRFPFAAPDRIAFATPAVDVAFGLRDPAAPDPRTGVAQVGILCDPDPGLAADSPAAKYRPAPDFTTGANASNLRGIFGFLALSSGQVAVIDVEDFDAKCRRPIFTNPSFVEDFRGCAGDTFTGSLTIPSKPAGAPIPPTATLTVTNEVSCHAVEPERARSVSLALNSTTLGTRAPTLRTFPKLIDKTGRTLAVDESDAGRSHPRMLGVNFSNASTSRAQVYVGTTLFARPLAPTDENQLIIDPTSAKSDQNSLVLSFVEPRSYASAESFSARFEGPILNQRPNPADLPGQGAARFDYQKGEATFIDNGIVFCDYGIEDEAAAKQRGDDLGVLPNNLDEFARQHADFALITSEILDPNDAYWANNGAACIRGGFAACHSLFGNGATVNQNITLNENRELRIVKATVDTLTVEPRSQDSGSRTSARLNELVACCFPEAVSYEVRASNEWVLRGTTFRHNIHTGTTGQCTPDKSALKSLLPSRVIEVSCDPNSADCADDGRPVKVGSQSFPTKIPKNIGVAVDQGTLDLLQAQRDFLRAQGKPVDPTPLPPLDVACVVQHPSTATQTIGQNACIYTGTPGNRTPALSGSFVIYRGQKPSERDMEFDWVVGGGFTPLSVPLGSNASSTPASMVFSPQRGELVIADGASNGILLLDLTTLGVGQIY